ncbi:hypothetical protein V499_09757 [Pseudogymnoascus sp. VKM F-103]|nr:hypothetical protein V499_09757 [Pseudogymnoascus sp. VKM F-103]
MTLPWTERKDYSRSFYSLTTLADSLTAASSRIDVTSLEESTVGIHPPQMPTERRAPGPRPSLDEHVGPGRGRRPTSVIEYFGIAAVLLIVVIPFGYLGYRAIFNV